MSRKIGWSWVRNVRWSVVLVLLVMTVGSMPRGARAADDTCSVGGGAGYASIQAAVNDAGCATITVAAGTYQENITIARAVTISGAGAGSTIVDGGYKARLMMTDPCAKRNFACTVFTISQSVAVTLSGMTIRHGYDQAGRGGGIDIPPTASATVTVQNSIVTNNTAVYPYCGGGIRLWATGGNLTISNSTFSGNIAGDCGGAIAASGAAVTVLNSTFSGNDSQLGGAIHTSGPTTITNSTFTGNKYATGGALNVSGATATVSNSTFVNNTAGAHQGGAIHVEHGGILKVSSSTFSGNSAAQGGAIMKHAGQVTLKSTILANNAGGNCATYDLPTLYDGGNNLRWPSTDGSCFGKVGDPKLAVLANNGGPTQTLALQAGSAAVNAGACTDLSGAPIPTDQREQPRPSSAKCDIGAFEVGGGYWTFDEGSGSVVNDSSGNGHTGTLKNGAAFTTAALPALRFANPVALSLTGSARQYVDLGSSLNVAQSSFSVAVWAKRSSSAGKQWIVGQGSQTTDKALLLGFRDNDRFTCAFYNDDLDTPSAYPDTEVWHHWACTFDATTRARKLYRDGVLVASNTSKGMFQASGAFNLGRATWNEGYFSGALDDMRVYNRALSGTEIQSLAAGNP